MGARQSKRSVDITTTPKKEGIAGEGGVVGDAAAPGDGKLERIEETDTKPTTNGIAPHTDATEDKEKDKDDATEKDKEKQEEVKAAEEAKQQESSGDSPVAAAAEVAEVTTPTEAAPASTNTATSPDSKEAKKKDKVKKKWSFRSISFSKKDKSKPSRDEAPKNGDVTKEEPLAEGGEEAETGSATAGSPTEEKSAVSSPTAENESSSVAATTGTTPAAEAKEEPAAAAAAAAATATPAASAESSPVEEKKEEPPTPSAPTPLPVEDKKEEVEKVEAEKKSIEVSRVAGGEPAVQPPPDQHPVVEARARVLQPVATTTTTTTTTTPSIIERKTSEDIPSLPPSSPPPTPIDPSPLQQAQQAAATVTALAEALKPAEAAQNKLTEPPPSPSPSPPPPNTTTTTSSAIVPSSSSSPDQEQDPVKSPTESSCAAPISSNLSTDEPPTEAVVVVVAPEYNPETLPVVENETSSTAEVVATTVVLDSVETENVSCETPLSGSKDDKRVDVVEASPPPAESSTVVVKDEEEASSSERTVRAEPPEVPPVKDNEAIISEKSSDLELEHVKEIPSEEPETVEKLSGAVVAPIPNYVPLEESKPVEIVPEPVTESKSVERAAEQPLKEEELVSEPTRREAIERIVTEVEEGVKEPECVAADEAVTMVTAEPAPELVLNSEEGPVPISDEMVVEAKPALVIPEDEEMIDEAADTDADVSKVDTESVEVIAGPEEEKLENELESDIALQTEEILVSDEGPEEEEAPASSIQEDVTAETTSQPISGEKPEKDISSGQGDTEESMPPPPLPESPAPPLSEGRYDLGIVNACESIPPPLPQAVSSGPEERTEKVQQKPDSSLHEDEQIAGSSPPVTETLFESSSRVSDSEASSVQNRETESVADETEREEEHAQLPDSEETSLPSEELPPAPEETAQSFDSSEYPLPPEELSCPLILPSNLSDVKSEPVPVIPVETSPRYQTETLLTPPRSPSPQSNLSIASGTTTTTTTSSTKDCSQTQLHDDQSNREFKMESVSISLNSFNESEIELKERLAESLAETENQEESVSCQLTNIATSTAAQEIHQSTPEPDQAPVVENNVAHENSTTESTDDAPKIAPPAVPVEAPASPPSAPAITEDVASVTKAIEEIDISDKAVAAATIECNTNEIIADQIDIKE